MRLHLTAMDGIRYLGPLEAWAERGAGENGAASPMPGYTGQGSDRRQRP
jgi:hypothetical protein